MKTKIYFFLLIFIFPFVAHTQYIPSDRDLWIDDIMLDSIETPMYTLSSRTGSFQSYYNNLNNWVPYASLSPNDPLKNPPITTIEISFHVFLDNNGGNNVYTDTPEGRNKLLYLLNRTNNIYSGYYGGPSDPVAGVVELPNYDTRIRFSLGNNNERIYFYKNTTQNHGWSSSNFYNYVNTNFPDRVSKFNVYFTAGHYGGRVIENNIRITNEGSGYTSTPTITFSPPGATATATIQNGRLTAITLTNDGGSYSNFTPPTINITGGGGSGATGIVTKLSGGATGYAPSLSSLNTPTFNNYVVMCHCYEADDWIWGKTLAHELAHNLDLRHNYCGGGASAVICNNYCSINCIINVAPCNDDEYLSDIFGPCPGTYPHISSWRNPYDSTIPDAAKVTNNLMGGSSDQRYISPMQAGIMHRTLALKSTGKYVKKETYSPMPLIITENQVWDFHLKLYRDITVSSGAILTLSNNFELPYTGTITVNSGAALVIENSVKLSENNKIIVKSGGTLKLESGSTTEISNNGYIEVQSGGYFCIDSGATIKLNDAHSVILLKPGYIAGVNTSLLSQSTCASPTTYSIIGNGAIKDYLNDVYIQNETISSDKYYTGTNIYVGRNVTTSKPQGDVIINNNAQVIFDAAENVVFDAGFECALGATFEVK